jgi:hypothetical protein
MELKQHGMMSSLGGHPYSIIIRVIGTLQCHLRVSRAFVKVSVVAMSSSYIKDLRPRLPRI